MSTMMPWVLKILDSPKILKSRYPDNINLQCGKNIVLAELIFKVLLQQVTSQAIVWSGT